MNHRTCFPCTILPEFTILDSKGLDEKLKEICDKAKAEPGCLFFGFARNANKLVGREAYVDGKAVHEHLANVGKDIEALVEEGTLEMETMTIHGPAKELEILQETTEVVGAQYAPIQTGFSKIDAISESKLYGDDFLSVYSHNSILDDSKAWNDFLPDLSESNKDHDGCYVYNLDTVSDSELYMIQHHRDASAAEKSVNLANKKLQALSDQGVAAKESLLVIGPKKELDALKPTFESFHPTFLTVVEGGFSRIAPSRAEALKRPQ